MSTLHKLRKKVFRFIGKVPIGRYNITYSEKRGFVWFRVAKTGTRSMLNLLKEEVDIDRNGDWIKPDESMLEHLFSYTFVRNPWDRLVSCYCDKVLNEKMFEECWGHDFGYFVDYLKERDLKRVANAHIRTQSTLFPVDEMDFIGRFECYVEETNQIMDRLKIQAELPHYNATEKKHYSSYYTNRLKHIVGDLYEEDVENFDYSFEDIKR